jgi:hypothetical protein
MIARTNKAFADPFLAVSRRSWMSPVEAGDNGTFPGFRPRKITITARAQQQQYFRINATQRLDLSLHLAITGQAPASPLASVDSVSVEALA